MLVKSKFFLQFVEKIEKLKLSLSKQHSKMLKMKSEMRKNRKKTKQSSSVNFPGNLPNPGNPEDPGKFPGYSGIFFKFTVYREVENLGKSETLVCTSRLDATLW